MSICQNCPARHDCPECSDKTSSCCFGKAQCYCVDECEVSELCEIVTDAKDAVAIIKEKDEAESTTVREYFTALWVNLDKERLEEVEQKAEQNFNKYSCYGEPDWGCDACPKYDGCQEVQGNARGVVVIEGES